MILRRRPSVIISGVLITLILTLALFLVAYIYRTTDQIREGLPQEVLEQQQSIFLILDDLARLLHATEIAITKPSMQATQRISNELEITHLRLQTIQRDYRFDFLYGAAAMYATAKPALQDSQRWLQQGLYDFSPDSAIVSEIIYLRIRDVYQQLRALFQDTNSMAFKAVASERQNLSRFRIATTWISGFFLLLLLSSFMLYCYLRKVTNQASLLQQYLAESIENLPEGIALFDQQHNLVTSNQRFRALFDLTASPPGNALTREAIYQHSVVKHLLNAVNEHTDPSIMQQLLLQTRTDQILELAFNDGRYIQLSEHPTQQQGLLGIFTDITHHKQTQSLLERMATHDSLTDLATRRLFQDRLERAIGRNNRTRQGIALMFIDLDNFKAINDFYGHSTGDQFLQKAAHHIKDCFRDTDTVARLGGDEFVVLLEGVSNPKILANFAERVLISIHSMSIDAEDTHLKMGASIGIAILEDATESSASLLRRADSACYQAKALGRNNYQFYQTQQSKIFSISPRISV